MFTFRRLMDRRYQELIPIVLGLADRVLKDERIQELAARVNRSAQVEVYDEWGTSLQFWVGVEDGRVVVRRGVYPATTTIRAHIDVILDILKRKLDFRVAVAHGLVEIEAHDGLPWFFHYILWASFVDRLVEILEGEGTETS